MTLVASAAAAAGWKSGWTGSGSYELVQADPLITTAGTYNHRRKGQSL